jgi:hypothetical protein
MSSWKALSARCGAVTLTLLAGGMLVACGGGGSSPEPVVSPPVTSSVVLEGSAATGAAIAGAMVRAQCASGSGSATTANDGRFTISIQGGSLPCVLRLTTPAGMVLHSVAEGTGAARVVSNITPLSQLLVSRIAGGNPDQLFASFDAAAQAKVSADMITRELVNLRAALSGAVDLSNIDPLKDRLVAATGSTAGNAFDQKLDQLQAALRDARLTIGELEAMMMANGTSAAEVIKTHMRTSAADCPALRSGTYRWIDTYATGASQTGKVTVDATARTMSFPNGPVWTASFQSGCKYSADAGKVTLVVSKDGIVIVRYTDGAGKGRLAIAFPEQDLPLTDVQGRWNVVGYGPAAGGIGLDNWHGDLTIDAQGVTSAAKTCRWLASCVATEAGALPVFSKKSGGGFDLTSSGEASRSAYVYKTAAGERMAIIVPADASSFSVAAPLRTLSLPAVGAVTSIWDSGASLATGELAPFIEMTTTISAVNETARSYTRTRPDGRVDGFTLDTPLEGLRYRAQGSSTLNGTVYTYSSLVVLPVASGMSVYITDLNGNKGMGVSVVK